MSKHPKGIYRFHEFCRTNALSYTLDYGEAEDSFSVTINSPAPEEEYYRKRVSNFNHFIDYYIQAMTEKGLNPTNVESQNE